MYAPIEIFADDIKKIDESDYGDFMRKANHYLLELKEQLRFLPYRDIMEYLNFMQVYIQFSPNWSIEPTRTRTLKDAIYLNDLLQGHEQDWES